MVFPTIVDVMESIGKKFVQTNFLARLTFEEIWQARFELVPLNLVMMESFFMK